MLAFALDQLVANDYTALAPRDFFIYESAEDDQALALVLNHTDPNILRVLTLSGQDAFVVRDWERVYNHHVLPLKLDPERLRIRVDALSTSLASGPQQLGRLVIGSHSKPSIDAMYAPERRKPYECTVKLQDWALGNMREPRFAFQTWALSYIDDTGQWVDLVKREPKSEA